MRTFSKSTCFPASRAFLASSNWGNVSTINRSKSCDSYMACMRCPNINDIDVLPRSPHQKAGSHITPRVAHLVRIHLLIRPIPRRLRIHQPRPLRARALRAIRPNERLRLLRGARPDGDDRMRDVRDAPALRRVEDKVAHERAADASRADDPPA